MVVDYPAGNPTAVGNRRVSGGMIGIMDYPCPPTDTTSNVSNKDSGCGCGAGTGTALLPPLFFSAGAWWRRRKKKHDAARA
jgi:MYXO-CTERM domain-containing protein